MSRRRDINNRRQGIPDLVGNIAKYVVIAILVLFFISETRRMYALGYSIFEPHARDEAGQGITASVTITPDMSEAAIAKLLEREQLIESSLVFQVQLRFSEHEGKLAAGTYELSSEMLPEQMMQIMSADAEESADGASGSTGTEASEEASSADAGAEASASGSEEAGETAASGE